MKNFCKIKIQKMEPVLPILSVMKCYVFKILMVVGRYPKVIFKWP